MRPLTQPWFACPSSQICKASGLDFRCAAPACADGVDNDSDGKRDYPNEPGCASPSDDDEADSSPLPACSDGLDNDSDGATDFPADTACAAASDLSEAAACLNGIDDDGDGQVDGLDPNCVGPTSDLEAVCTEPVAGLLGAALPWSVGAASSGQPSRLTANCGGSAASPEQVYEWTPPTTGSYVFEIVAGNYDTVLHLHEWTCVSPVLACDDDAGAGTLCGSRPRSPRAFRSRWSWTGTRWVTPAATP